MSVVRGTVVVGVDGSPASAAAVAWAARDAEHEGRRISVVHACGLPGALGDVDDIVVAERGVLTAGRALARAAVVEIRVAGGGVAAEEVVTIGDPTNVLVQASETAALLVVGARGRGSVASALLGSVSAAVARHAHCPVVVVRDVPALRDRPVVAGVDGTATPASAVEFAFHRASSERVPLTLLHATQELRSRPSADQATLCHADRVNLSEEEELLVAETVAGLSEKYPDVTVTELYRRGDPTSQLVEASGNASLVVVGSRGRGTLRSTLLGSVSRAVAEKALCPVAVVRP